MPFYFLGLFVQYHRLHYFNVGKCDGIILINTLDWYDGVRFTHRQLINLFNNIKKLITMKKLFNIWASMAIATIIVTVLYLCSGCTEVNAANESTEYYYEDNFVTAPCEGICLQDTQFTNGSPFYNGKPCIFTASVCEILTQVFYNDNWEEHPIAAIAFNCGSYYVIELD